MKGYYKKPELTQSIQRRAAGLRPEIWVLSTAKGGFRSADESKPCIRSSGEKHLSLKKSNRSSIISVLSMNRWFVESKGKLVAMVHFNMEELEKQVQKIKSQAGNYKTAINDYIEEQKKELFEYVNSRVNNFSKLQLVLVQHEPFEKTPTHKIKRFLYNNINIK